MPPLHDQVDIAAACRQAGTTLTMPRARVSSIQKKGWTWTVSCAMLRPQHSAGHRPCPAFFLDRGYPCPWHRERCASLAARRSNVDLIVQGWHAGRLLLPAHRLGAALPPGALFHSGVCERDDHQLIGLPQMG